MIFTVILHALASLELRWSSSGCREPERIARFEAPLSGAM